MKFIPYLLILLTLFLFTGNGHDYAMAETNDGTGVFLPETTYDFGAVCEGDTVRHHFIMRNNGPSPLNIIDVKTD